MQPVEPVEFDRCPRHWVLARTMRTTEKLIEEIKLHNILFDLSHPNYKNIKKNDDVWEETGRSLGTSGKFTHFHQLFII
jgi:hypothetical protein